jgi:NitT/TauT family transport system permease protein
MMRRPLRIRALVSGAPWSILPGRGWSRLIDAFIFAGGIALLYGIVGVAQSWLGPFTPQVEISRSPGALPFYAVCSLARITLAYGLSLAFTLVYGHIAAYNAKAERFMVPVLDVLQSIPVLSFLPGLMLAMVALFPHRQLGIELGAILLIFTGQVWNMAFSFYSSLRSIPREMRETATIYRFSWWQRFTEVELPFAAIGLVWNSMMSVAGGWFFLMACEMFVLGSRDFRLPGLGSYLQTAASAGDTTAILWGVGAMIMVIVLLDQLVWRPVIAWAEKFKVEQVQDRQTPRSWVLDILRRSGGLNRLRQMTVAPVGEWLALRIARKPAIPTTRSQRSKWKKCVVRAVGIAVIAAVLCAVSGAALMLAGLGGSEVRQLLEAAGATFLRVNLALLLGAAWTIPAGVAIGLSPRLARVAQPVAQIAASVPATALFPVVLLAVVGAGGGLGIASILLLLLGTQWYILFNVIAGAIAIPTDLREATTILRLTRAERWRSLILPGIFPYLITGLMTASGGAWNASIVAEYFRFRGQTISTVGLGATISRATDSGNFNLLLAATCVMAAIVVVINRTVWRRLYALAETRFKLEA